MNHKKAFEAVAKRWKDENNGKVIPDLPYNGPTKEPDEFSLIAHDLDVTATTTIQNKYEAFADDTPFTISGTALSWWLEPAQQTRYPTLSQIAAVQGAPTRTSHGARSTGRVHRDPHSKMPSIAACVNACGNPMCGIDIQPYMRCATVCEMCNHM